MIPNRIHFIFGLDPEFGGKPFSFVHYLSIRSAWYVNNPDQIMFYFAYEPSGPWWEMAKPLVTTVRVNPITGRGLHYAHHADLLRLEVLLSEGGIYLDCDTFCINSFTPLLKHNSVLGIEPNSGLCNAVILAERGSEFIREWTRQYDSFDPSKWNYHSVQLPYNIALEMPALVHIEGEYAFFFPSYDDPMSDWLWRDNLGLGHRLRGMSRICSNYFRYYRYVAGPRRVWSYFRHTLSSRNWYMDRLRRAFCLHLWESLWWERHLRDLTPKGILRSTGVFSQLIREVLPDLKV